MAGKNKNCEQINTFFSWIFFYINIFFLKILTALCVVRGLKKNIYYYPVNN